MYSTAKYKKIIKYLLLSFICSDYVFSAINATALRQGDGGDEGTYDENRNTTLLDFLHLNTTKRYPREDMTIPTIYPEKYIRNTLTGKIFAYICVASILIILAMILISLICYYKPFKKVMICSADSQSLSSISLDGFPRLHLSYEQSDFSPEVQRPPVGKYRSPDPRRVLCVESERTDLFSELYNNLGLPVTVEVAMFCINSASSNSSNGSRETNDAVTDRPDESGRQNDLNNPPSQNFLLPIQTAKPLVKNMEV
ncbi:unnamed protein product [Larinioides sclopetarius]|uniref:Uncharacterized protein n=1 Tax=Larinioides sclopetarius TaxID=280406 RepID=A0AAV2BTM7_9ARAC